MPIVTTTAGKTFNVAPAESILDAALKQGVQLAYSCRTGRCSSCKCKVGSGTTSAMSPELGLSEDEKVHGWVLACVRTAETDLSIEADDLSGQTIPPPRTLPCRIHTLDKLAPDVLKATLRLPPSSPWAFLPGQYIDIIGQGGVRRSYSVANASRADQMLELHIRAVENGVMSRYWFEQAKPNDLLRLNGPLGTFFLRDVSQLDLVFLATGTGIAPVKAMLEGLEKMTQEQRPRAITVFWGGRTAADLYWAPSGLTMPHRFVPVLSRGNDTWLGARGHVQDALLSEGVDLTNTVVYACGSDAMIHGARHALLQAGLQKNRFLSDAFVCSAAV
ncbi:2Fe-2S iron-sulfur cluster-binding protein [Aquabacterium sp.]|uniref:2Fe-2S iron-sulfur cluster-binding protein n=1 Tax=Aquabacterium sp. TaxID=1872578 RepID=UPI002487397A|nr:2Fe-2S iron-sulfur cluster-binding protein [Aquabacterium sp.]MDI1259429.1 FAD-binding oxidoreductase [Aquabacterium sp.]